MSEDEYKQWRLKERQRKDKQRALLWYFILSLMIIPAPIVGVASLISVRKNHDLLAGAGGAYLGLGYGTVFISLLNIVLYTSIVLSR
jgi:uncharacterized membrane protein